MVVKTQLLVLRLTSTWGWGQAVGSLQRRGGGGASPLLWVPAGLCCVLSPRLLTQTPSLLLSSLPRRWASVSPCVGPTPAPTEELQDEECTQQSPCHPAVCSWGYSELWQALGGQARVWEGGGRGVSSGLS